MRNARSSMRRGIFLAWAIGLVALVPACGKSNNPPSGTGGIVGSGGANPVDGVGGSTPGTTMGSGGTIAPATGGSTGGPGMGGTGGSGPQGFGGSAGRSQPGAGGAAGAGAAATGGRIASGGSGGNGGATGPQAAGGTAVAGSGAGGKATATGGAAGSSAGGSSGSSNAKPSAGCGKTPPASGRATISVSGASREYILKVPDGYDPNHPYRLIFGFHGAKYDDNWVADGGAPLTGPFFGMESEAKGSAIFVAPQGASGTGDLAFVDAMVSQFKAQLCVDENRVFAAGFSMGAMMTITIGCNRSDVFRGIAPMSGQIQGTCPAGNPVAYWASHGTKDPTISISNGEAARDEFAKRNSCGTQASAPDENNCVTYQGCKTGYPVVWCTFEGVHEPAPFAGPAMWKFLAPL